MKNIFKKKRYKTYIISVLIVLFLMQLPEIISLNFSKTTLIYSLEFLCLPLALIFANYYLDPNIKRYKASKKIWIKLFVSIIIIVIMTLVFNEIEWSIGVPDDDTINLGVFKINEYWTNVVTNIILTLLFGAILFIAESVIDKQKDKIHLEKNKVEGLSKELNLLKLEIYSANVKPHFIFNALNGLITLIHEEPVKAEKLVLHLSNFLRSSLYTSDKSTHTMEEEFEMLNDYLGIETIRFGDKISYLFNKDKAVNNFMVPKFFLLPLIENCIKHNSELGAIKITVESFKNNGNIQINVKDNGKPFANNFKWNGGLKGTEALLKTIFNTRFYIDFINEKDTKSVTILIKNV